jgi:hypothetical protein
MERLVHTKASRTKILNTFPTQAFGNDGDIVISRIAGRGVYLCTKVGSAWYVANKLEELRNIGKTSLKSVKVDNLEIKDIPNAQSNTDKFIVSDKGRVKYRSGDEIVDDLSIPIDDINYKQAYCSLGQYDNKEECEANGGAWYYSDNDSHDSISSTAENQLLTIGQSIGTMDAEPTLLYDGSTLEIKRNTYFDENWQTSAQNDLLKLSYDSDKVGTMGVTSTGSMTFIVEEGNTFNFYERQASGTIGIRATINADTGVFKLSNPANVLDYFSIDIDDNAVTEIKTNDSGSTVGHLTLVPDGDLVLDPASQKTIISATDGLYFDGGTHTYIAEGSADRLDFYVGGVLLLQISESTVDAVHINCNLSIDTASKLWFDGSVLGHTYIQESSNDVLDFYVGAKNMLKLDEANSKITLATNNLVAAIADGTEYSAANSAYAGMILGYTCIGANVADDSYTLTTSFVCFTDSGGTAISVTFKTPPSEYVEIEAELYFSAGSGASDLELTLSNHAVYGANSLTNPLQFDKSVREPARGHSGTVTQKWFLQANNLAAIGSSNTIYIAAKCDSTSGTPIIRWGGDASGEYTNLVMKAVALPATIVEGS